MKHVTLKFTIFLIIVMSILYFKEQISLATPENKSIISSKHQTVHSAELIIRNTPVDKKSMTVQELKFQYEQKFKKLRYTVNDKLDNLMEQAYNEYKQKQQIGEEISYFYFYNKYKDIAVQLEENTDTHFNQLYKQLQVELESQGYKKSEASEFRAIYEKSKSKQKKKMLKRFVNALG
ncbi:hypothetical protein [Aquibacillus rhizosphaerae]|uniref:Uncharacterized protein n=1 Tax=Aquibacillus rhizosphaerae TaxID=3051431 RepID=A0ABT7L6M5_9BACI|nr:hypothetical protein [Aquibacillus sp. LR5S19]MDL4840261.1 hypothetical protein [Aquibacillus sp. LR5S19]